MPTAIAPGPRRARASSSPAAFTAPTPRPSTPASTRPPTPAAADERAPAAPSPKADAFEAAEAPSLASLQALAARVAVQDEEPPPPSEREALANEWLRRGLDRSIEARFPRFARAMLAARLDRALAFYGHTFGQTAQGEPTLLVEGKPVPWSELERRFTFEGRKVQAGDQEYTYFANGLEPWAPRNFKKLRPMKVLPEAERPTTHQLEIVIHQRDHAWIRLLEPNGNVTSLGLLSSEGAAAFNAMARTVRGEFSCPDPFEQVPGEKRSVALPIDPSVFDRIVERVEKYNEIGPGFNWYQFNCGSFAAHMAQLAGEKIDLRAHLMHLLVPEQLTWFVPEPLQFCVREAAAFIGNFGGNQASNAVLALLGGFEGVKAGQENLGSILDGPENLVFGESKFFIDHPDKMRAWQRKKLAEQRAAAERDA